ncbi:MAG TPA: hypothetical protein DIS79_09820 [Bacteroidetes bacterium]|nr:hypothetical protein [Bacteroidota bacterium]
MEWQPWLVMAGDTFTLRPDDSTGGVWGFGLRHSSGSVVQPTDDNRYRYRLETSGFSGSTLVLSDVERKDALSRWPKRKNVENMEYNTDTLWLAINLRRNDASSDVGHEDDVVLRVRVPYWLASNCWDLMGDSALARFLRIPRTANGRESVTSSLGQARGDRWQVDNAQTTTTEIAITRRMLPQTTDTERDITIYAGLVFNYIGNNDLQNKPHNNPYFNTHTSENLTRIRHIGVDVYFEDNRGVDIAYVRLESSEARRVFWGGRDMEIRDNVATFMTRLRNYNLNQVNVPGEQPRLWRIYGRDEIRPMHWKGFRYMNRLLHDYVTTEWEVSEYNKSRHCLRLREYW